MMKRIIYIMTVVAFVGILSCSRNANPEAYVPVAPEYSDETMWHNVLNDEGEGADVFYVVSTWEFDWYTANACTRTSSKESKHFPTKTNSHE